MSYLINTVVFFPSDAEPRPLFYSNHEAVTSNSFLILDRNHKVFLAGTLQKPSHDRHQLLFSMFLFAGCRQRDSAVFVHSFLSYAHYHGYRRRTLL